MSQHQSPHKAVAGHHYVHVESFAFLSLELLTKLAAAERLAQVERVQRFNVARFEHSNGRIALLNYPNFFEDAYPVLYESWNVDVGTGRVSYRTYRDSLSPPVLHRKELMLPEDHPRRAEFQCAPHFEHCSL